MGVEVGIKFAAGMFGEPRPQQSARRLVDDIARFPLSNGVQKGPPIGVEEGPPFQII